MVPMVRSLALKAIAAGIRAPENVITRYLELSRLKQLLEDLKVDCVLDVGANRGQFAGELRGIGFRGHIVSFEPLSREFAVLSDRFSGDRLWRGHNFALGSTAGPAEINVFPDLTVMSSLLRPTGRPKNVTIERIQVRRLDELRGDVIDALGVRRVFLKMDTQGFDLEVFKGAGSMVGQFLGLQSELSIQPLYEGMPHYLDALTTYEQAGFELFDLTTVSRRETGALQELNCFMYRSEKSVV